MCVTYVCSGDYDGRTPLHLSASEGRLDVVKWVLSSVPAAESAQAVNAVDAFGGTPLQDAMEHGHSSGTVGEGRGGTSSPSMGHGHTVPGSRRP